MIRFILFIAKIAIILYLASQAFADYDVLAILYEWMAGKALEVPYGINSFNTIAFLATAFYVMRKELKRSKKIAYCYSPESARLIEKGEERGSTAMTASEFGSQLNENLSDILGRSFPPMIPLQFSDILTTKGFELKKDNEAEGVLQYVEELSPLEVATNAVLNWLRQEAQYKQFTLELHFHKNYDVVSVESGNPDTDTYLCVSIDKEGGDVLPQLSQEAALRMFFESESRICSEFEAFTRFYRIVQELPELYKKYGSREFDAIHTKLIADIDCILKLNPGFLTMQVLKGIVFFHHRNKSTKAFREAESIFLSAIENAREYYGNYKTLRRRSLLPAFMRKGVDETLAKKPQVSRRTKRYVQGLSEIFLGRIFAQNAHRFGSYDADAERFLGHLSAVEKRVDHGIRYLNAASRRMPFLAWVSPVSRTRLPLAYHVRGLIFHCHDYLDRDEIYYRDPSRTKREPDSVRDLERAIKVYSRGLKVCDRLFLDGSTDFATHAATRLHNNCGYARLYSCLIRGRLGAVSLRSLHDIELAEFSFFYSAMESATFHSYPLANLGLLYAMEGEWELSWMAGVAALDKSVYSKIESMRETHGYTVVRAWKYSEPRLKEYREWLRLAIDELGMESPSLENPYDLDWSYVEGISELSYGFIFRSICEWGDTASGAVQSSCLGIGLKLHRCALERFVAEEIEEVGNRSDVVVRRFRNLKTNLVRAFWHFDDRGKQIGEVDLLAIHGSLHQELDNLSERWEIREKQGADLTVLARESIDDWMRILESALGSEASDSSDI